MTDRAPELTVREWRLLWTLANAWLLEDERPAFADEDAHLLVALDEKIARYLASQRVSG